MTTKKAITELEELIIKQARIALFDSEVKAMQHLIDIAKRFQRAVEVETYVDFDEKEAFLKDFKGNFINEYKYNLYAIPKELSNANQAG